MTDAVLTHAHRRVPTLALLPFILMTFAITWGLVGIYIVRPEQAAAWFGEISGSHPFFFLAQEDPRQPLYSMGNSGVQK